MTALKTRLRQFVKVATHLQLMPVLESGDDPLIGGQAVIEGVMMRAPHSYCTAVRRPDGEVVTQEAPIHRPSERRKIWGWYGLRGLATLGQALKLGFSALQFSAANAIEEEEKDAKDASEEDDKKSAEIPGWMMALNIAFSLGFFIFLYKFVPLVATTQIKESTGWLQGNFAFSMIDGVIRLAIFLTFLTLVSADERYPPRLPIPWRGAQSGLQLRIGQAGRGRECAGLRHVSSALRHKLPDGCDDRQHRCLRAAAVRGFRTPVPFANRDVAGDRRVEL